ncbi:MAG TPA: head GIN domain-containing protein [Gemmataceae bacterium]|nr:head GIN domain-containing protein [Gemmataceae bacterium]
MKCAMKVGLLVLVVAAVANGGCSGVAVEGSGVPASEERPIGGITEVTLSGTGNLVIVPSDTPGLIITADENLLDYIEAKVSGKTLSLRTKSGYSLRPKTPIKYTLLTKRLDKVGVSGSGDATVDGWSGNTLTATVSGAGNMTLRNVVCNSLTVSLSGAGNMSASGTARIFKAKVSGAGDIDATGLETTDADVQISGAGDISLWTTGTLKARVSGAGDVKYKGSPSVEKRVSGAGSITAITE